MKKLAALTLSALLGLALMAGGPAQAQDKKAAPAGAAAKKAAGKKMGKKPAGKMDSVHGPVKGAPTGDTFVVAARGKTVTVDASKAKIRVKGKFAKMDVIKAGTMVTAKGTLSGDKLMATEVTAYPSAGGKKGGKKAASGKMAKPKMTPTMSAPAGSKTPGAPGKK